MSEPFMPSDMLELQMVAAATAGQIAQTALAAWVDAGKALNELLPLLDAESKAVLQPFALPFKIVGRALEVMARIETGEMTIKKGT